MQHFVHDIEVNDLRVTLRCYIPEAAPHAKYREDRPAVIVFPGGAYRGLYGGEAEPIALQYLAAGVCAFVLDYSVAPIRFPQALLEALTAVRYVRDNAEAFGVNPQNIAVCGFSAGGHLAGSAGILWKDPRLDGFLEGDRRLYRPDKMILCYPVTTSESHQGSFKNLLGEENQTPESIAGVSLENFVDEDSCPAYIWHNCDDASVDVAETLLLARLLCKKKVPVEMRIYPTGGHGTCLGTYVTKPLDFGCDKPCAGWVSDTLPFLFR